MQLLADCKLSIYKLVKIVNNDRFFLRRIMTENILITPADIRQQQFKVGWRGFSIKEVDSFLDQVADTLNNLMGENDLLNKELGHRQNEVAEFKKREQLIKDTLINAQKVIENMKSNAQKEAEIIINEAEIKAEKILRETFNRQGRLQSDIEELQKFKATLNAQMRSLLNQHLRLLEQDEPTQEPNAPQ
jgi:cell division initiation protein